MIRGIIRSFSTKFTCLIPTSSQMLPSNNRFLPSWVTNKASSVAFSSFTPTVSAPMKGISENSKGSLLEARPVQLNQTRTLIKFSWKKAKRKSVRAVTSRFFRLHWGIWIRTIAGRHKKLWKKTGKQKNRLQHHVFCNSTQSKMLDKMVSKYWRRPKYYIDDPYAQYHKREEFHVTRTKPWRPEGCDYE